MSIQEIIEKCKGSIKIFDKSDVATIFIIILVASSSFGLGRLSKISEIKNPITVGGVPITAASTLSVAGEKTAAGLSANNTAGVQNGTYVASKNGTKYYFPWCSGATRIKEENKVWFDTKEAAIRAGFQAAANCSGL